MHYTIFRSKNVHILPTHEILNEIYGQYRYSDENTVCNEQKMQTFNKDSKCSLTKAYCILNQFQIS